MHSDYSRNELDYLTNGRKMALITSNNSMTSSQPGFSPVGTLLPIKWENSELSGCFIVGGNYTATSEKYSNQRYLVSLMNAIQCKQHSFDIDRKTYPLAN